MSDFSAHSQKPDQGPIRPLRNWAASVLDRLRPQLRPAASDHLSKTARQTTDSQEVVDSVLRRIDKSVLAGKLAPGDEQELYRVARRATINAAIDRSRYAAAQNALLSPDLYSERLRERLVRAEDDEQTTELVYRLAELIDTPNTDEDREMFFLRVRGVDMKVIAQTLDISHDAARARWSRLCEVLRAKVDAGALGAGDRPSAKPQDRQG